MASSIDRARSLLARAIDKYRKRCEDFVLASQEDYDEEIFGFTGLEEPYDRYTFLSTLLWCLDHREKEPGMPTEALSAVMMFLNVPQHSAPGLDQRREQQYGRETAELLRAEERDSAQESHQTFAVWPRDDRIAIYEWLKEAETWDVVLSDFAEDLKGAKEYWRAAV